MSLQKWKELAKKRILVEHYYKEKDKAIKDYKFRRGVSSDFWEGGKTSHRKDRRTDKKTTGRTDREDDRDKGIDYHWIPDKYKQVSELVAIKNDADTRRELRLARDMATTEVRDYGNKARGIERRRL